ncbi:DNA lyase [candidate division KSB1 bacterium]|nr:DNA lyase [candidate division KSB1 bacterium]
MCTEQLDSAVDALCPAIWGNMQSLSKTIHSEEKLWEELVCCILSSQVKYELSQVVTQNLKRNGLLDITIDNFFYEYSLRIVLKEPVNLENRFVKYRFPNSKAKQIASAWEKIYGSGSCIRKIIESCDNPKELRLKLTNIVSGLGMKQASMYLRNISNSYELAVIDTHVLNYMKLLGISKYIPSSISKTQYLNQENILIKYAENFGYPVGCVDHAIWIVMRVAKKDGYV